MTLDLNQISELLTEVLGQRSQINYVFVRSTLIATLRYLLDLDLRPDHF